MTYTDAVKSGFRLINRNWQLVVVQAAMMIANCIGFFVIVGVPLGIAFIIFGLDLTGLAETRDIMALFSDPSALLSKYMGLVLIVVTSFLIYILIVATVGLFVFAGSAGTIGLAILDPSRKFSMKLFFAEGKRIFFPLTWFSMFMGLVFIAITFLLGLLGGGVAVIVQSARSQDSTLALFLGIFFSLLLALIAISIILAAIAVTVYGIAVLFFKTEGAIRSFRDAVTFLWNRQSAFWLYVILFFAYLVASFGLVLFTYPFILVPVVGTIISFPLQLLSSYLGLAILATIFVYYHEAEIRKPEAFAETPEAGTIAPAETVKATGESSSASGDISGAGVPEQEETPPAKELKEEA
jgi:hypothetical protein